MLPTAAVSETLSVDEFVSALRALTTEDWIRVGEVARRYARYCSTSGDDLQSEAISRTLDGKRNCPYDVDPVAFLILTMKSIAGELRKAGFRTIGMDDVKLKTKDGNSVAFDPADERLDPESTLAEDQAAARLRAAILGLFNDDEVARDLADLMMVELDGEELRALLGLEPKAFASKRRLVRRRIDKAFPDGWKP
jgi:Ni,Fe-hydrogenase III component G